MLAIKLYERNGGMNKENNRKLYKLENFYLGIELLLPWYESVSCLRPSVNFNLCMISCPGRLVRAGKILQGRYEDNDYCSIGSNIIQRT